MRPGEVYRWQDDTDRTMHRFVIVRAEHLCDDYVTAVPIYSQKTQQQADEPTHVPIAPDGAGIVHVSVAHAEDVTTLTANEGRVDDAPISTLDDDVMTDIRRCIGVAMGTYCA